MKVSIINTFCLIIARNLVRVKPSVAKTDLTGIGVMSNACCYSLNKCKNFGQN